MRRRTSPALVVIFASIVFAACSARVETDDTDDTDDLCHRDCELNLSHTCNRNPMRFQTAADCIENCESRLDASGDCGSEVRELYECRSELRCHEYGPALDPDDASQPCFEEVQADNECRA